MFSEHIELDQALHRFKIAHPCKDELEHQIKWESRLYRTPGFFGDEVSLWGRCTRCKMEVRAVWVFHNVVKENK